MIHILAHASDDYRCRRYYGLVTINNANKNDSGDATAQLARIMFLSGPGLNARCNLGLSEQHSDYKWAAATLEDFFKSTLGIADIDGEADSHGVWLGEHEKALEEANASGGVIVKRIDDISDCLRPAEKDEPDVELIAALRALKDAEEAMARCEPPTVPADNSV